MSNIDLSSPQRQSKVGVIVVFFNNLRKALNYFFSFFLIYFTVDVDSSFMWISASIVSIVAFILAFLKYQRFYFYSKEEEFIITQGVLNLEKIAIPFERIQSIHIHQNIIQKFLKVVSLKIDTAGSVDNEIEIAALPQPFARSIQDFLYSKKALYSDDDLREEIKVSKAENDSNINLQFKLGFLDVLKIGITDNHLKTSIAIFALFNGIYWQGSEFFNRQLLPYLNLDKNWFLENWYFYLPVLLISIFLISVILSLILNTLKHYNLKFISGNQEIIVESGLLKRVHYQLPIHKLQYIKFATNPLRWIYRIKTLIIKQASSKKSMDKQSLMVPGCSITIEKKLIELLYPETQNKPTETHYANSYLKFQLILFSSIIPSFILLILTLYKFEFAFLAIVWLVLGIYWSIKYASTMKLILGREVAQLSKGWIFPERAYFRYYKIQNVSLSQNIFQKRRKVAHLDLHTASGNLRMWQLDEEVARKVLNYLLYQIESSRKNWM